ncbi:MAG: S9 family peptidase [Acidobacteriota bacterium]|nr:MAG: S9 family peptidase [Acidobacteriota bacterium]
MTTQFKLGKVVLLLIAAVLASCSPSTPRLQYPESRTVDHIDLYHGVEVKDPYRWLEDLESKETATWVKAENEVTFGYLEGLPGREELQQRLERLWDFEKYGVPEKTGGRYFYTYNTGLQNQSVVYRLDHLDGEPVELLDPNTLTEDGTAALTAFEVSPNGQLMAYGISQAGSDWQEWQVRNVESGEDLQDHLRWIKFSSVSWLSDSSAFVYSRYDEPTEGNELANANISQKVYLHRVGTSQDQDELLYSRPDQPRWLFGASTTDDGRYLLLSVRPGSASANGVFYRDLQNPDSGFVELLNDFDARYLYIGNQGTRFWFQTDSDAPLSRVVEIDITRPAREDWKVLIPEAEQTLTSTDLGGDRFVCSYLEDARSRLRLFTLDGQASGEIELPGIGAVSGLRTNTKDSETFYSFTSFRTPSVIYRYDVETNENSVFREARLNYDPQEFETIQEFIPSKDGTRIPIFISYKKGLERNGKNPTILYGYGGFNISRTPRFSVSNLVWMERGGVFVSANLRGGGEYGEQWHLAGTKLQKQNVFDDFIAAAEWLIENEYTSTPYLAIEGGSNGGLLVGACTNQRPELFGAAVPHVGVMDMLRFTQFTIGWAWVSDFGSPEDPDEFKALYAYSPYHNIQEGIEYPSVLITTADHDDRVVPSHSFKYAARLQKAQAGPKPILIRIETKAGHAAGKPTSKQIEEAVDKLSFLFSELG